MLWHDGGQVGGSKRGVIVGHKDKLAFESSPDGSMEFSRRQNSKKGLLGEGSVHTKPQSMTAWAIQKTTSSHG